MRRHVTFVVSILQGLVVLHFNTQHMNCQGATEVFFTQIESNQSIVLFFKIATLRYTNIFKASFFLTFVRDCNLLQSVRLNSCDALSFSI